MHQKWIPTKKTLDALEYCPRLFSMLMQQPFLLSTHFQYVDFMLFLKFLRSGEIGSPSFHPIISTYSTQFTHWSLKTSFCSLGTNEASW